MLRLLRRMLTVILVLAGLTIAAAGWMFWQIQQETVTPLETLNAEGGAGRALAILNPGLSDYPRDVMNSFAGGLAEKGWRIDHTTASGEATTDYSGYDLLVLVSPIYSGQVAPPLQAYVARAGDFGGMNVVAVITSAGDPKTNFAGAEALISKHNGVPVGVFGYATMAPNAAQGDYQGSNTERGIAMARDAARSLAAHLP